MQGLVDSLTVRMLLGACALPHSNEIGVANVADIADTERNQSNGAARRRNEFDFDTVWFVDFDNRAEVAELETMLG
jgi:hypothetical protein